MAGDAGELTTSKVTIRAGLGRTWCAGHLRRRAPVAHVYANARARIRENPQLP